MIYDKLNEYFADIKAPVFSKGGKKSYAHLGTPEAIKNLAECGITAMTYKQIQQYFGFSSGMASLLRGKASEYLDKAAQLKKQSDIITLNPESKPTPEQMRQLFLGAIKLQEDNILDCNRRIEHYRWALAEMDKQNNVIEAQA